MLSLSAVAKEEKNKLATDSAFILLLDIELLEDTVRICHNNEDITWNGNIYQSFPFELGDVSENTDGSDPNVTLTVDNTSQALQYMVEGNGGAVGTIVILRVVNTKALDNAEAEIEEYFAVTKTSVSEESIVFTLGNEYSSRTRRPLSRYMKNNCPYHFKDIRCGYNGTQESCDHTLTDCRKCGNVKRFGGFPGITQKGVYVH